MTEEMSLCGSAHWGVASWMVEVVDESRLLAPFNARCVDKEKRMVRDQLVQELYDEFHDDERLQGVLSTVGREPQVRQSVMREALKHIVEKAYSKHSSTYPEGWFDEYRSEMHGADELLREEELAA